MKGDYEWNARFLFSNGVQGDDSYGVSTGYELIFFFFCPMGLGCIFASAFQGVLDIGPFIKRSSLGHGAGLQGFGERKKTPLYVDFMALNSDHGSGSIGQTISFFQILNRYDVSLR